MMTRTRSVPWIGCGTSGSWICAADALEDSHQDYEVEQVDAFDDLGHRIPGVLVNRRIDTKEILGSTSDRYGVIQNHDGFAMLDPFAKAGGVIEHAGQTEQGMVFMVMRMPFSTEPGSSSNRFDMYICAMNSFNTRFPMAVIITPVRVVCQNMFRKLMSCSDTVLSIKHGRLAGRRMAAATEVNDLMADYIAGFNGSVRAALATPRSVTEVDAFVEAMFPYVPVDAKHPKAEQSNDRIRQSRRMFLDDYYDADDNQDYKGTSFGLLNAYYDWVSHSEPSRMAAGSYADRRLGNLMLGTAVDRKLLALA